MENRFLEFLPKQNESYGRQNRFEEFIDGDTSAIIDPSSPPPFQTEGSRIAALARKALAREEGGIRSQAGSMTGSMIGAVAVPALFNLIPGAQIAPEEAVTVPLGRWIGSGAGRFITSSLGSWAGGGIGQTVQDVFDPTEEASLNRALWGGTRELLSDVLIGEPLSAIGKGVIKGGKSAVKGVKYAVASKNLKKMVADGSITQAQYQAAKQFLGGGGELLETQVTKTLWPELKETIARGAIGGRDIFKTYEQRVSQEASDFIISEADKLFDSTVMSRTDLGNLLARHGATKSNKEIAQELGLEAAQMAAGDKFVDQSIVEPIAGFAYQKIDEGFEPIWKEIDAHLPSRRVKGLRKIDVPNEILDPEYGIPIKIGTKKTWNESDDILGVAVPTKRMKEYANKLIAQNKRVPGSVNETALTKAREALNRPEYITIPESRLIDKQYREAIDHAGFQRTGGVESLEQFRKTLHDSVVKDTKMPDQYRRMYEGANTAYGNAREQVKQLFDTTVVDKLSKNPENVLEIMGVHPKSGSGEGPMTQILRMRDYFEKTISGKVDPVGQLEWQNIQKAATQDILLRSTESGKINSNKISKYIKQMNRPVTVRLPGGGKKISSALMELHGKEGKELLERAIDLDTLMKGRAESMGLIIHGMQAASITAGAYGGIEFMRGRGDTNDFLAITAAGAMLIGPRTLAKSLTSKRAYELTKAIAKKPRRQVTAALIAKLTRQLAKQDNEDIAKAKMAVGNRNIQTNPWPQESNQKAITTGYGARGY